MTLRNHEKRETRSNLNEVVLLVEGKVQAVWEGEVSHSLVGLSLALVPLRDIVRELVCRENGVKRRPHPRQRITKRQTSNTIQHNKFRMSSHVVRLR